MRSAELLEQVQAVPRAKLAQTPTPLDFAPRLSAELGVDLYVKREDSSGLAFGGNYVRMAEFTMADVVESGAKVVIHGAAEQPNHCRQVAAAAAKLGLECHVIVRRSHRTIHTEGNLLLCHLFGATAHVADAELGEGIEAEKLKLY